MKRYKTYVFDFDYTLVDSSRGIVTCFRHVLDRHGYADVTEMSIKRTIGKTLEQSFSILTGINDMETLAAYKREYMKEADTHMTVNTFLFPETVEVLRSLKAGGASLGIVSTKFRYRILDLLEQRGQTGLVDFIVGGEDVQAPKPAPEGLLAAIAVPDMRSRTPSTLATAWWMPKRPRPPEWTSPACCTARLPAPSWLPIPTSVSWTTFAGFCGKVDCGRENGCVSLCVPFAVERAG